MELRIRTATISKIAEIALDIFDVSIELTSIWETILFYNIRPRLRVSQHSINDRKAPFLVDIKYCKHVWTITNSTTL